MLEQFFRDHKDVQLTHGERWLVYNGKWIVYQHLFGRKKTTIEYEGYSLETALKVLGG